MFGNSRQSNQPNSNVRRSVNTTFKFLNSDYSSLQIGGWDTQISIRFTPFAGRDQNNLRTYDINRRVSTALFPEKALTLKKGYDTIIAPAVESAENGMNPQSPLSVSVVLGGRDRISGTSRTNVLSIEFKPDPNETDPKYYHWLTLYQNVNQDSNIANPENIFTYKFGETSYIEGYNAQTGQYASEHAANGEFGIFYKMLENAADMLPIAGHSVKQANVYTGNGNQFSAALTNGSYHPTNNAEYSSVVNVSDDESLGLPFN